ncbi:C40 family peptidase [Mucilaginibacter sp. CSA2-8R]|uniref:C40 family peptidase n=1 Tax=Mucilaginibacter sp. CSA2-8R TaxID=3141542 RepID=UPI00315D8454
MPFSSLPYKLLMLLLFTCKNPDKPFAVDHTSASHGIHLNEADKSFNTKTSDRIETGNVSPAQIVSFAQSLKGIPYKYGSTNPSEGFDCSGFITYVFNHFNINVPRTSVDFTSVPKEIKLRDAKAGDIILFTGTDSTKRNVGHMGIFVNKPGEEHIFIHATSGKANSVTETPLNAYYQGRFVKAIRIFSQNN